MVLLSLLRFTISAYEGCIISTWRLKGPNFNLRSLPISQTSDLHLLSSRSPLRRRSISNPPTTALTLSYPPHHCSVNRENLKPYHLSASRLLQPPLLSIFSAQVFGTGELVLTYSKIVVSYFSKGFWLDFIAALPLPQVLIWITIPTLKGSTMRNTKNVLKFFIIFQNIPRLYLIFPPSSQIVKATGVVTETAWAGAAYNLMLYMLASHILQGVLGKVLMCIPGQILE
ncbi:protein CNGC15c [Trifolium repens]|nr:protein CNGC15c [Trifolium repens]